MVFRYAYVTFHLVSPRRWGSTMFFKLANTFLLLRAHFYKKYTKKIRYRKNRFNVSRIGLTDFSLSG